MMAAPTTTTGFLRGVLVVETVNTTVASPAAASMSDGIRMDHDEFASYHWNGNPNAAATATDYDVDNHPLDDARVFWCVNAFLVVLLTGVCLWCCYFGPKSPLLTEWLNGGQADADRTFQETVRQRHERRMAARNSTPARRTDRLTKSFRRNNVQMVVREDDIIPGGDDNTQRGRDNDNDDNMHDGDQQHCTTSSNNSSTITTAITEDNDSRSTTVATTTTTSSMESDADAEQGTALSVPTITSANDCDDNDSLWMDHPTGFLVLRPGNSSVPPPSSSSSSSLQPPQNCPQQKQQHGRLVVPNCCAICLGDYNVGDTVVWSCNVDCQHAFHMDCIMEWLLKQPDGGTPCPCCRQEFTDWETERQERKIKWAAGNTFDLASIAL